MKKSGYTKYPKKKPYVNNTSYKKADRVQDKEIKTLAKKVKKLETEPELKYVLNSEDFNLVSTVPQNFIGPLIEVGSSDNERIGSRVTAKYLDTHVRLVPDAASLNDTPFSFRWIIVWDLSTNGSVPDSMFLNTTTTPNIDRLNNALLDDRLGEPLHMAPFYHENKDRYKVLLDKKIEIRNNYDLETRVVYLNERIQMHNAIIDYTAESATFDALNRRAFRTFFIVTDNTPIRVYYFERFFYTDV